MSRKGGFCASPFIRCSFIDWNVSAKRPSFPILWSSRSLYFLCGRYRIFAFFPAEMSLLFRKRRRIRQMRITTESGERRVVESKLGHPFFYCICSAITSHGVEIATPRRALLTWRKLKRRCIASPSEDGSVLPRRIQDQKKLYPITKLEKTDALRKNYRYLSDFGITLWRNSENPKKFSWLVLDAFKNG